jgi:hypothetical protein
MKRANGQGSIRRRGVRLRAEDGGLTPHRSPTLHRQRAAAPKTPTQAGEPLAFGPGWGGAGLGKWTPDGLRHSAASLLLAQGVPLKIVAEASLASACEGSRGGSVHWGSTTTVA